MFCTQTAGLVDCAGQIASIPFLPRGDHIWSPPKRSAHSQIAVISKFSLHLIGQERNILIFKADCSKPTRSLSTKSSWYHYPFG